VAFVRDGDRLTTTRIPGVMPAVETQLVALRAQWSRFSIGPAFARRHQAALLASAREVLWSLHRLVLEPVLPLLDAVTDELVVVPHRRLHQVPFHALYDGAAHLVERWAVTAAPSDLVAAPSPAATAPALVLAVPDAQAPLVAAEAQALAAVLPHAEVLVGADATWDALRAAVPGPALLHIACHGLYRPGNPLFSALRLADRWVTSAEVLELDLRGSLVTLSACESGRHGSDAAEPAGLAWAFLAAGATGAVVSQWVAHDAATTHLMSAFYGHLAAGQPPAHALRAAQLATAQRWPHPFFWAPFSHVASPVREGSPA
jgi:CHAT domain-containing protein